ncbi:hypothetical protein [Thiomicrorhabdus sediminis]|uniref:Uncharacterized protein n=1 Tax=Thiomicrorhabdus sediminis TaxID=2580412 RepID=A0A4P9K422_9GAMM|nr:hypothetical protein [Thiomicrorhabdus sediminis]QCU89210.1 hypothetical protein FE785_00490 [Thiomicrorhabdus sediminis]
MHLVENKYETAGLQALAPNARDIAEHLLTVTPLSELVLMVQQPSPRFELLIEHKVNADLWPAIVKAALLAKATYFLPNRNFNKDEISYLMKAAALAVDMPLDIYSVKDIVQLHHSHYPVLVDWLKQMLELMRRNDMAQQQA